MTEIQVKVLMSCTAGHHTHVIILPLLGFDRQEYIRRQLEEEQRHLEMLQEQLLREQAMLLVSLKPHVTFTSSNRAPLPQILMYIRMNLARVKGCVELRFNENCGLVVHS